MVGIFPLCVWVPVPEDCSFGGNTLVMEEILSMVVAMACRFVHPHDEVCKRLVEVFVILIDF